MKRLHSFTIAAALAASALLCAQPALACKCMLPTIDAAREDASALFEGRVTSIVEQTSENTMPVYKVTLAVVRSWKGLDRDEQVDVFTNTQSAACGYTFAKGTSYLVYARENEGRLQVSLCGRTRPLADAAEDLAKLGAGATPVRVVSKTALGDAGAAPSDGALSSDGAGEPAARAPATTPAGAQPPAQTNKRGCAAAPYEPDSYGALFGVIAIGLFIRRRRAVHVSEAGERSVRGERSRP